MVDALIIIATTMVIELLCGAPRIKEVLSHVRQKK
jgi:hypothetical protein